MSSVDKKPPDDSNWPRDYFGRAEMLVRRWLVFSWLFLALGIWLMLSLFSCAERRSGREVIVYASQDQVYAEPVLKEFERETGIRVRAVFDSEAAKTVGLVNRLLAERRHPQCDVFWNGEEFRTHQLAAQNVFRETNAWTAFGYRSRRIAIAATRTNLPPPASLVDLTNLAYRGRAVLSYPLFGTTATHFLALRQKWGAERWREWCAALAANRPFIVDGNSVAAQFVARGEAEVGLTDSDDIAAVNRERGNLRALPLTADMLLIPNTVAVIRNCPHPDSAQQLFAYLQRRAVAEKLVAAGAIEGVSPAEITTPTLQPDWSALLRDLDAATEEMKKVFRR